MLISVLLFACTKIDESILSEKKTKTTALVLSKTGTEEASTNDTKLDVSFEELTSSIREIVKNNPDYFNLISRSEVSTNAGGSGGENFHCCNGICLTVPENPDPGVFYYPFDAFGNKIEYIANYGSDPRNIYYVYLPSNVNANSKIALLIHGGGWFSGPDGQILGFPFSFAPSGSGNSLVKDLLDNGFVVVSMLYRLSKLGNNSTEFQANPNGWQEQINDIELAVNHIRANFQSCLWGNSLNANSIQILGESAGGHLALMYAYTHPGLAYIKSITSMYAPTNLQTFGNWVLNTSHPSFSCGNAFTSFSTQLVNDCGLHIRVINYHAPFYWPVDYNILYSEQNYFNNSCTINNNSAYNSTLNGYNADYHIYNGINLLQSAARQVISNPLTSTTLSSFSPRYSTNVGCYPTFIMHGREDVVVPYTNTTTGMESILNSNGGVVITDNIVNQSMPASYTTPHLVRKYCKANHGWVIHGNSTEQITLYSRVRADAVTWMNNH